MVFEAVEAIEEEDYYVVTLAFRPQDDFSGPPGQEQFFIEKEGTVAVRQVLAVPVHEGLVPECVSKAVGHHPGARRRRERRGSRTRTSIPPA